MGLEGGGELGGRGGGKWGGKGEGSGDWVHPCPPPLLGTCTYRLFYIFCIRPLR